MADIDLIGLTTRVVAAYVSKNPVPRSSLSTLIADTYSALSRVGSPEPVIDAPAPRTRRPRTIFPDRLISLEDGRPYKALRRHLSGRGLTPEAYRQKWNLQRDYPMVAEEYSSQRSAMAKELGLGRKPAPKTPATKATRGKAKK